LFYAPKLDDGVDILIGFWQKVSTMKYFETKWLL
jgi:hypothetical protein